MQHCIKKNNFEWSQSDKQYTDNIIKKIVVNI